MPNPIRNFLAGHFLSVQPDGMTDDLWARRKEMQDREELRVRRQGQLDAASRQGQLDFQETVRPGSSRTASVISDPAPVSPTSPAIISPELAPVLADVPVSAHASLSGTPSIVEAPVQSPRPVATPDESLMAKVEEAQPTSRPMTVMPPPPPKGMYFPTAPGLQSGWSPDSSRAGTPDYSKDYPEVPGGLDVSDEGHKAEETKMEDHSTPEDDWASEAADGLGPVVGAKPYGAKRPMMIAKGKEGQREEPKTIDPERGRRMRHPDLTSMPAWRLERGENETEPQGWNGKKKAPAWL